MMNSDAVVQKSQKPPDEPVSSEGFLKGHRLSKDVSLFIQ